MIGIPKSYQITTGCLPKPFNFRHRFSTKKLLRPMKICWAEVIAAMQRQGCRLENGSRLWGGCPWGSSNLLWDSQAFPGPSPRKKNHPFLSSHPSKPREINHRSIEVISKSLSNHLISSIHQPIQPPGHGAVAGSGASATAILLLRRRGEWARWATHQGAATQALGAQGCRVAGLDGLVKLFVSVKRFGWVAMF